ncbi:hypothetical protein MP638_005633 [Amoeboaphelidium occidentale]|nr:hypothetical protein MP638_005633 [Amoeboaphelidium occidentale]
MIAKTIASNNSTQSPLGSLKYMSLVLMALVCGAVIMILLPGVYFGQFSRPVEKKSVIFMVTDGFGPASETFARTYYQYVHKDTNSPFDKLPLDSILIGSSRTKSGSSWITDSAAGATAFSCAQKTYNGAIAVNSTYGPCATILEAAKLKGYITGMVVTASVTDATPASFASHVTYRWYEQIIAEHLLGVNSPIGRTVDLLFGGGLCQFVPQGDGSCRKDGLDLISLIEGNVVLNRSHFDALDDYTLPVTGLFSPGHMPYAIDRNLTETPSLKEMVEKSLKIMKKNTENTADDKGFFMLIEGSRIDHAAHNNDPAAHVHEILAYQEMVEVVKQFVEENPGTILVSTSDHETGGLDLGVQLTPQYPDYAWYPEVLSKVKYSTDAIASMVLSVSNENKKSFVSDVVLPELLGVDDFSCGDVHYLASPDRTYTELVWALGKIVSDRAMIGWSTHGHTGVDVNLYGYAGSKYPHVLNPIRGNVENTDIGKFLREYLSLDESMFKGITEVLNVAVKNGKYKTHPDGQPPVPEFVASNSYHGSINQNTEFVGDNTKYELNEEH